jgi:hypothetical protein
MVIDFVFKNSNKKTRSYFGSFYLSFQLFYNFFNIKHHFFNISSHFIENFSEKDKKNKNYRVTFFSFGYIEAKIIFP